jgi:hypothetical protein
MLGRGGEVQDPDPRAERGRDRRNVIAAAIGDHDHFQVTSSHAGH